MSRINLLLTPVKETKRQRANRERESQVWERSVQALGSPPQGTRWVHVGDRSSDIFSFLMQCRNQQCEFLVRAAQDRCVDLLVEQAEVTGRRILREVIRKKVLLCALYIKTRRFNCDERRAVFS